MTGLGPSLLTGEKTTRYASRNIIGTLLGPTAGTVQDIAQTGRAIASPVTGSEVSKGDVYAMRRLLPFQNVFYLRSIFDILERKTAESLGAK